VEDVLARACDDWLHVAEFAGIAKRVGVDGAEALRATAIGLIVLVLVGDLMVIGDVDGLGFHAWPGSVGDAVKRLVQTWPPDEPFPPPGAVAWLSVTPEGQRVGEEVLLRERPV